MRGRGNLVVDFCSNVETNAAEYYDSLPLPEYNPFNLLLIDFKENKSYFFNNTDQKLAKFPLLPAYLLRVPP